MATWQCVQCGKVAPWDKRTWRSYYGPWMVTPVTDGVVCSDECDDAMLERWGDHPVKPAPHAPAFVSAGVG